MADRRKDRRLGLQKMFDDYVERLQNDFTTGAEQSAQGVGDIVERGNVLTGIPRLALGGLGWMGSPVSAAVSPVLGPLLAPVAEATDTYVGQPVERMTGYPADLTNEIFLSTAIPFAGAKVGKMASPYLSRLADAAETGVNRAGYTFRPPEGTFFSGAGPVKLADEVPSQITLSKNPAELKKIYGKQDIENTIQGTGNTRVFTIKRNDGPVIGSVDGRIEGDAFTVDLMAALQGERSITYAEMRELGRQIRDELPPSVQYIQGMRGLQGLSARGKAGRPGLARVALKNLSIPALAALLGYQIIDSPEDDEGFTPAPA